MSITPHIDPNSPDFPGDPTPQPPFGFRDTLRSAALWSIALPHFAISSAFIRTAARVTNFRRVDFALKALSRSIPSLVGVKIETRGQESIDPDKTYVYVANHVNIFDLFALYQAIPQYTRALEHVDHFSWPIIGSLITEAGQIPVDPDNPRRTAKGLREAATRLQAGESITILPEGSRTLDGSLGPFLPGAFRLAIRAKAPVVPIAIRGGRAVSRRGDWRIRPGKEEVLFAAPIPTDQMRLKDAQSLSDTCRQTIIDLIQNRRDPGT